MPSHKILVCLHDDAQRYHVEKLAEQLALEEMLGKFKFVFQNFEKFQEGNKADKFDQVIIWTVKTERDDIEMSLDFYQYYSEAPVVAIIVSDGDEGEIKDSLKNQEMLFFLADEEEHEADTLRDALSANRARYDVIFEQQVKEAFQKFDKDGSGAIDRNELAQLSKELGHELTEE